MAWKEREFPLNEFIIKLLKNSDFHFLEDELRNVLDDQHDQASDRARIDNVFLSFDGVRDSIDHLACFGGQIFDRSRFLVIRVATKPGRTVTTWIPLLVRRLRKPDKKAMKPTLVAPYTMSPVTTPPHGQN